VRWRRALTIETATNRFEKIDLTLDEEDLDRLLSHHLPGVKSSELTLHEAWQLLEHEAEYLLSVELLIRLRNSKEENQKLISEIGSAQDKLLNNLRQKYPK